MRFNQMIKEKLIIRERVKRVISVCICSGGIMVILIYRGVNLNSIIRGWWFNAVMEMFFNGFFLKVINFTYIVFILKVVNLEKVI